MPDQNSPVIDEGSDASSDATRGGASDSRVSKELEKEIRANLKSEMERHNKKELETTKKQLEEQFNQRVAELEAKIRPSNSESQELQRLMELKNHPDSRVWKSFISDSVKEVVGETEKKFAKQEYDDAIDMVNDWADEAGVEREKFKEEINKFIPRVRTESNINRPAKLVRAAYKEWKAELAKEKELQELRNEKKQFMENGRPRVARKPEVGDQIKEAKKSGNWGGVLSALLDKKK